ncbi:TraX family protein [Variovorax sp. RHLX14]|uniref:TraX family protein n=1 Tax=Variovorax sp. RHLX14 TaxID=1259731 RepID=UPI003F47DD61
MALPSLVLTDGTLEALKYLALVLMTVDHVNKYLFNGTHPAAFAAGRSAPPIFALVLAYNLARPYALERGVYRRTASRLLAFGLLATPAYMALGGLAADVYPLNIMFTLLLATVVIQLLDGGSTVAAAMTIGVGGCLVEFGLPAVGLCIALWFYVRRPTLCRLALGVICLASLQIFNGNAWALAAFPLLFSIQRWTFALKRCRWLFYLYYPAHLLALWLIRLPMAKAGYLFF